MHFEITVADCNYSDYIPRFHVSILLQTRHNHEIKAKNKIHESRGFIEYIVYEFAYNQVISNLFLKG